jgi:poly-gamma-glutamate synthesis protein (capsule biosynthesis protein)
LHVGAGRDLQAAKAPVIIEKKGIKIGIIGYSDNEPGWLAEKNRPGIYYVSLHDYGELLEESTALKKQVDILIATQHIGPNMVERPPKAKIAFAHDLIDAGVDLVHSHSSHIFQGVEVYKKRFILHDTGDFIDDYYVDPYLRNDRSFFFVADATKEGIKSVTLTPVLISNLEVNLAAGKEREETVERMCALSREFGTTLDVQAGKILFSL